MTLPHPSKLRRVLLAVWCAGVAGVAAASPIAVIYPDIGEPYRAVFSSIIDGIEKKTATKVSGFAVGDDAATDKLAGELRQRDVKVVIALGRHGLKAASRLEKTLEVLGAGVIAPPENELRPQYLFTLAPDPSLLFARLKTLLPGVRKVTVVHDPRQSGWLVRLAQNAARQQGLELSVFEAGDLRSAIRHYQSFFAEANPSTDALWLPQDSTAVEESAVLPLVLKASWNQNVPVFSSALGHVKRGVLFALFPNHLEMGRQLGASATGILAHSPPPRDTQPLREVQAALNIRTAKHLGLNLSPRQQQGFDLILPE